MDWAKHTAVLVALIAAAGLMVTAWGTLKTAQVADEQLAQAREQRESSSREQTERITFWWHADRWETIIANRTLDAAPIWIEVGVRGLNTVEDREWVQLGILPPCQRLEIPTARLMKGAIRLHVSKLLILDRDGKFWERTADGVLHESSIVEAQIPDISTPSPDLAPMKPGEDEWLRYVNIEQCGSK
ncbi:hypothetical protein [Streptomyces zhihengii]|uniref:Secreted protein n=1 Tax=Streptomyces zhihengii TaxID=1818004 RepID=A0ABS2V5T1_9ACTN|nr:hypothetical protein [Streptomyces zhihengii]MBM9624767.1 hypothetical protein [Streptomyces zhihengii]